MTVPEGETRADFSIFVVDDAIPELAEKMIVSLLPTEEQAADADIVEIGSLTKVTVTVKENDDVNGVIEFSKEDRRVIIHEPFEAGASAGSDVHTFTVLRKLGRAGAVQVNWEVVNSGDQIAKPHSGVLKFPNEGDVKRNPSYAVFPNRNWR